jgi:hypothetical protein
LDELGLDLEDEIEVADEVEQEPDVEGDVPGKEQQQLDLNNNQHPADEAAAHETPCNNQSQLGNTRLLPRCTNPFVQPRSAVRSTVNEQMEQLARQRLEREEAEQRERMRKAKERDEREAELELKRKQLELKEIE